MEPVDASGWVIVPPTPFVQTSVEGPVAVVVFDDDSAVAMKTISFATVVVTLAVSPEQVEPVTPVPNASSEAVVTFPTSIIPIAYVVDDVKFTVTFSSVAPVTALRLSSMKTQMPV